MRDGVSRLLELREHFARLGERDLVRELNRTLERLGYVETVLPAESERAVIPKRRRPKVSDG